MYFVEEAGRALRYPVGIGTSFDQWEGVETLRPSTEPQMVSNKDIQSEMSIPPVFIRGRKSARTTALYLGDTLFGPRHQSTWFDRGRVWRGCFRMHNAHIIELYDKVQIRANVHVVP